MTEPIDGELDVGRDGGGLSGMHDITINIQFQFPPPHHASLLTYVRTVPLPINVSHPSRFDSRYGTVSHSIMYNPQRYMYLHLTQIQPTAYLLAHRMRELALDWARMAKEDGEDVCYAAGADQAPQWTG